MLSFLNGLKKSGFIKEKNVKRGENKCVSCAGAQSVFLLALIISALKKLFTFVKNVDSKFKKGILLTKLTKTPFGARFALTTRFSPHNNHYIKQEI
jgi:hypothetical protein